METDCCLSDGNDHVTITLSDSLFETNPLISLLKNQLGGNKVIQLDYSCSSEIPNIPLIDYYPSRIAVCPEKNLIFFGCNSKCQVFDLESKKFQRDFEIPCYNLKYLQVDSLAEYAYLRCDDCLLKFQLDNLSIVWKYSNSKAYSSFVFCEAKNEIYLYDTKIIVLNSVDGSLERQINLQCHYYEHLQLISYDLKEEKFYMTFCSQAEGDDDDEVCYCIVVHNEKSGHSQNIHVSYEIVGISFSHKDYFICWKKLFKSGLDLYEKETNRFIASAPNVPNLYGRDYYFDYRHDILYCTESNTMVLKIVPLSISTSVESVSLDGEKLTFKENGANCTAIIRNLNEK